MLQCNPLQGCLQLFETAITSSQQADRASAIHLIQSCDRNLQVQAVAMLCSTLQSPGKEKISTIIARHPCAIAWTLSLVSVHMIGTIGHRIVWLLSASIPHPAGLLSVLLLYLVVAVCACAMGLLSLLHHARCAQASNKLPPSPAARQAAAQALASLACKADLKPAIAAAALPAHLDVLTYRSFQGPAWAGYSHASEDQYPTMGTSKLFWTSLLAVLHDEFHSYATILSLAQLVLATEPLPAIKAIALPAILVLLRDSAMAQGSTGTARHISQSMQSDGGMTMPLYPAAIQQAADLLQSPLSIRKFEAACAFNVLITMQTAKKTTWCGDCKLSLHTHVLVNLHTSGRPSCATSSCIGNITSSVLLPHATTSSCFGCKPALKFDQNHHLVVPPSSGASMNGLVCRSIQSQPG